MGHILAALMPTFLSTPSARRATCFSMRGADHAFISIHALREEGDYNYLAITRSCQYFYPRPPRGGRLDTQSMGAGTNDFYPRPPRGGRRPSVSRITGVRLFLSTPSARRATTQPPVRLPCARISIHALCEEGDRFISVEMRPEKDFYPRPPRGGRPLTSFSSPRNIRYFYPRPPRGGRRVFLCAAQTMRLFLSTPSVRRATDQAGGGDVVVDISIHALREEGDARLPRGRPPAHHFYPRPP